MIMMPTQAISLQPRRSGSSCTANPWAPRLQPSLQLSPSWRCSHGATAATAVSRATATTPTPRRTAVAAGTPLRHGDIADPADGALILPTAAPPLAPRCLTIITGASRGLGAAIARVLATRGPPLPPSIYDSGRRGGGAPAPGAQQTAADCTATEGAIAPGRRLTATWTHDLVLLASEATRLSDFVTYDLAPLLAQQQQQQQGREGGSGDAGSAGKGLLVPTSSTADGAAGPCLSTSAPPGTCVSQPLAGMHPVTRIRTAAFDLGDLSALVANTEQLLATGPAPRSESSWDVGGRVPVRRPGSEPATTGAGGQRGLPGGSFPEAEAGEQEGEGGVLPLPPSAYTHVVLVHNAGQVGDLAPLQHQSLENMRRQTDLNVTSFVHLTAAVLRTFLTAPLMDEGVTPALGSEAIADKADPAASQLAGSRTAASEAPRHLRQQPPFVLQPGQQPAQGGQRRVITIVNISSVSVDQPYEHFSLYGMGKAARHMVIRSVAHEAALREGAAAAASSAAAPEQANGGRGGPGLGASSTTASGGPRPTACVRALSYAPGAIDTEMQAAAREALPAGPLKSRFEENARCGRLVDPQVSAAVLYDILAADSYDNGAHMDYYSAVSSTSSSSDDGDGLEAAMAAAAAVHPLARGRT